MKSKKLLIPSLIIIFLLSLCLNTYLENWNTSIKAANLKLSKGIEYYNIASNAYSIQDMDNITIYADKAIVELSTASVALENAMIEAQKSKKDWLILYTNYYLKKVQALKNAAVEIKILKEYFINGQEDGMVQSMNNLRQYEIEFKEYDNKMEDIKRAHISEFQ
ncbi:MAG: hypothetical protein APG08_01005 [Candidatus Methanofastidiosum methylothiophilum]|jgi:hypothetical protein|uniref:Uncharacterized protein n=1 Tax=Candidatus Methanofastidiosum methylothiophilum TaxID=1705564 RepID=A0A150JGL7_9EURY|nr:MAG: hypothetical protein AN188_01024 [Candidatus Methanofastidiosum methylthiophilus]MBP6932701.1 hypothetical protein [Methanofastidiosum sp.]OQC52037.1 MAG: hypothetical protein BWX56_00600 [Euryarchaeota archaeon ADurb.Bin023]KYC56373.1 MAG: hypothetical protein APG08_01005 [Candidatus Methanofastidiosum methylthiophilus]KYC57289.1 MAG: hypothetical protein APG09_01105 [Candidatus Methanofastidiosum methylthiophilus]